MLNKGLLRYLIDVQEELWAHAAFRTGLSLKEYLVVNLVSNHVQPFDLYRPSFNSPWQ